MEEESKLENVVNECMVKGEGLLKALDEVYAYASKRVEERFRELDSKEVELKGRSVALEERGKKVEEAEARIVDLEMEVEAKRKELKFVRNQVEVSLGEADVEEVRLSQLRILVEECEAEQVLKASELGLKGGQLAKMETDLQKCRGDVSAEMEVLSRTQTHRRQLDEEVERKTKELTLVKNKLAECEKLIEISSSELFKTQDELECKREHLGQMEAEIERHRVKVSEEMESLRGAQTHMRQLVEEVERKTKGLYLVRTKLLECETMVKTSSSELIKTQGELECKQEQLGEMEADLERHRVKVSAEMESLRGTQTHMRQLVEEVERKTKDLTLVQTKLVEFEKLLETSSSELIKTQGELQCKREQLEHMEADFQMHHVKVSAEKELWERTRTHSRELEEEIERKRKDLTMVLDKIAECERQLESVEEQLDSQQKLLETQSSELVTKEKELQELSLDIDLREQTVISLNSDMEETCQQMESNAKELENLQKLIEEHSEELVSKVKQRDEITDDIRKLSLEIEEAEAQLIDLERRSDGIRMEVEANRNYLGESNAEEVRLSELRGLVKECAAEKILKESELSEMVESCRQTQLELERYHLQVSAEMDSLRKLDKEAERKLNDLTLVQDKIAECEKMFETRSSELVSQEKKLDVLNQKIDLREQTVISLNGDIKEACQRMETKRKELENMQSLIEERSAQCESLTLLIEEHNEQLASAEIAPGVSALTPVNSMLSLDVKLEAPISIAVASRCSLDIQQDITLSHLPIEDALLGDIEDSTFLSPDEVSTELRMFKDPGRFVLTSVEKALTDASERGELSLEEPILVPLIHLLEELARVGISTDPDLQSDATKVEDRWVEMMGARVEKSQLEAWAYLHFIAAFGLVKGTKQEQTLQIASYVAHFKHAPRLFESLGLTHAIPSFVTQLFSKRLYIPAIRLMFTFNVKNNFSPLELLKVQIINLRRSAKENTRHESQAEEANRDAATMMDIMELIEDFKLEIDIPADLILKFIVPALPVPVQTTHMPASDTVIQSLCIASHGSDPSLPTSFGMEPYQAGGSTALLQGQQNSHHAGSKRPRVDPRPVIRPCSNPPSGFGSFECSLSQV